MKDSECLKEYRIFSSSMFLKESKTWKKKIYEKKIELANMPELPAIESSGVQSSNISNMTQNQALKRMAITEEIVKYQRLLEIKKIALDRLTDEQRELINGLYFSHKYKSAVISEFGTKHYMGDTMVYRLRNEALDCIAETLEELYKD